MQFLYEILLTQTVGKTKMKTKNQLYAAQMYADKSAKFEMS